MMSSTEPRGYRITVNIVDKRHPSEAILSHVIEVVAYDATDAIIQAGFEANNQGLFDPESGLELKIAAVQPRLPPYSTLTGAVKGPLDERLAKWLSSVGH